MRHQRYIGSSLALADEIKKHGRSAFKKQVIALYDTKEEARREELRLIAERFTDPNLINRIGGGWNRRQRGKRNKKGL